MWLYPLHYLSPVSPAQPAPLRVFTLATVFEIESFVVQYSPAYRHQKCYPHLPTFLAVCRAREHWSRKTAPIIDDCVLFADLPFDKFLYSVPSPSMTVRYEPLKGRILLCSRLLQMACPPKRYTISQGDSEECRQDHRKPDDLCPLFAVFLQLVFVGCQREGYTTISITRKRLLFLSFLLLKNHFHYITDYHSDSDSANCGLTHLLMVNIILETVIYNLVYLGWHRILKIVKLAVQLGDFPVEFFKFFIHRYSQPFDLFVKFFQSSSQISY